MTMAEGVNLAVSVSTGVLERGTRMVCDRVFLGVKDKTSDFVDVKE